LRILRNDWANDMEGRQVKGNLSSLHELPFVLQSNPRRRTGSQNKLSSAP